MSPAFQKQCRALGNDFLVGLTMCIWRHCATVGTIVVWNIQFSDSFNSNPDKVECSVKMTELWPNWVDSDIRRSELGRTPDLIHFTGLISCLDKQMWWKLTLLTHLSSLSRPRLVACVSFCQQVIMSWSWRRKQIILKMNWAEHRSRAHIYISFLLAMSTAPGIIGRAERAGIHHECNSSQFYFWLPSTTQTRTLLSTHHTKHVHWGSAMHYHHLQVTYLVKYHCSSAQQRCQCNSMEDNIQRLLAPSLCLNAPDASESIVLKRFQQGEGVNSREISLPPPPSAVSTGVGMLCY